MSRKNHSLQLFIRGGLGNQLFQLSGAFFHAKRLSTNLIVNETALISHHDFTRKNWVSKLDLSNFSGNKEIEWVSSHRFNFSLRKKNYREISEEALITLSSMPTNLSLRGWFQSSYFPLNLKIEKNSLTPKSISNDVKNSVDEISKTDDIAGIHMRFGDFAATSWGTLSRNWYQKAFNELDNLEIRHVHIYSDEIDVAKKLLMEIPHRFSLSFPESGGNILPHELLWLMRQYRTFISSNSTLSWWASYLNINENPRIFCPWEEHLYLKPWIKID
jgi:hypothetical protein